MTRTAISSKSAPPYDPCISIDLGESDELWNWIRENGTGSFKLTFDEIEKIAGIPIDHSFLNCKKELLNYGYKVGKISRKGKTVDFEKV